MDIEAMELGLVFWAEQDAETALLQLRAFGLRAGQLGVPPAMQCGPAAVEGWRKVLEKHPVYLSTAVCAYAGEDYASLDQVHRTVGFTAPGYAAERLARTREVAAFAAQLGIPAISCHLGFIPTDQASPIYRNLLKIARDVCDTCQVHGQNFVLETGQESAATLLAFLRDADRTNLRINFDPANMILYGSGDPLQALERLHANVVSVHCKDGRSPTAMGRLGEECALGEGEVDFPAFLAMLRKIGYQGLLTVEREESNVVRRTADIYLALSRLRAWKQALPGA